MKTLTRFLTANALFSAASGLSLVLAASSIAGFFGSPHSTVFRVVGLGLLLFAGIVYLNSVQRPLKLPSILSIIVADFLWVLGSLLLLAFKPFQLSPGGYTVIALVAGMVLLFGLGQAQGLGQIDGAGKDRPRQKELKRSIVVQAGQAEVWKVISDVGNYKEAATGLDHTEVLSGEGVGMVRSCATGKRSWTESCTAWEEGKEYTFQVHTEAEGYPFPLDFLQGTWSLDALGPEETRITAVFRFRFKRRIHNLLLYPMMRPKARKDMRTFLENWKKMSES